MPECAGPRPPSAFHFVEPLITALGKATKFKSGVFVRGCSVLDDIIRGAGYDPKNLAQYGDPALGWRLSGWKPLGFRRRVQRTFWNARTCKNPLVTKGPETGLWGLTEAGVARARLLTGGRNLTAEFLDRRLKATGGADGSLMGLLRASVTKRLPRSASAGLVDEHLHNWFVRFIGRDSLRERLLRGQAVPDTLLATYAVRSGFTDIRKMGTDPVCRELYGARTEREREAQQRKRAPLSREDVTWKQEGSHLVVGDFRDTDTQDASQEFLDTVEFETLWANVERAVRTRKPKAWPRYLEVLRMRFEGFTVKEIAGVEGVSRYRASSIVSEARRCLREAREVGTLFV